MKVQVLEEISKQEEKKLNNYIKRGQRFLSNLLDNNGLTKVDEDPDVLLLIGKKAIEQYIPKCNMKAEHGKARMLEDGKVIVPWMHPALGMMVFDVAFTMIRDAEDFKSQVNNVGKERKIDYEVVEEEEAVDRLFSQYGELGFDVESTSPTRGGTFQTGEASIVGASFSQDEGTGFYCSLEKEGEIDLGLAGMLESQLWTKIVAGGKFETKTLKRLGVTLYPFEDIQLAAALTGETSVSLKVMGRQILDEDPQKIQEVWSEEEGDGTPRQKMEAASWTTARDVYERNFKYGCTDSDNTLQLWQYFKTRLTELNLWELYEKVEKPLVPILVDMEEEGVDFNETLGRELLEELLEIIYSKDIKAKILVSAFLGEEYLRNTNSRHDKSRTLDALGWSGDDRTDTGLISTSADSLIRSRSFWPELIDNLIDIDKYTKLAGFVRKWLSLQRPVDGKIHGSINQSAGAISTGSGGETNSPATGRLSMSEPNLNQVPNHSDEVWGDKLRSCFYAPDGWLIMAADAEQEEPRTVAVVAKDKELQDAFNRGTDIYRRATCAIYPFTIDDDMSDAEWKIRYEHERFGGKTFFLAWYYGAGASTLVKNVDSTLTLSVAQKAVANLASAHPARDAYLHATEKELIDNEGWITDIFGRKRFISETFAKQGSYDFHSGLRKAANFKVQGPCSTILKQAMIRIDGEIRENNMRSRLLFPVHDEVVLKCPVDERYDLASIVQNAFRNPFVDLPISVHVGKDWGHMGGLR